MAFGEVIVVGILFIVAGLIALSWWRRSLVAVVAALILVLANGAFFQPWTVIAPSPSNDPYNAFWISRLRVISVIWALLVVAAVACLVRVIRHKRHRMDTHNAT